MALPLPLLSKRFHPLDEYQSSRGSGYSLLPFRFLSLDQQRYIVTNLAGEYVVLDRQVLSDLVNHRLEKHSKDYDNLKSQHFLADDESTVAVDLLSVKYRTKQNSLSQFTSLFMFVTTLRCDHSCPYCQVSRQSANKLKFDMPIEIANRSIDFMFKSPSPLLKVEFQGGESLLNFELLKHVVEGTKRRNLTEQRDIEFVVATNLALLEDEHLRFFDEHRVYVSTSLDGPAELHNQNRPRPQRDSYERTIEGIRRVRSVLGHDRVSALMTTTEASLAMPEAIIDEYVRQGFRSIFLRSISPYGFATKTGVADRYAIDQWLDFYRAGLAHILRLNYQGIAIREHFASIILTKMLTPFNTGYVDLRSPAGIGISAIAFNYDGDVYASDEARMLAEEGDKSFRLGSLWTDSFESIMTSPALIEPLTRSMAEAVPMCSDCGVIAFCGSDPVLHHKTQGDCIGFKPSSSYCKKNMAVIRHLVGLLEDDPKAAAVLKTWT